MRQGDDSDLDFAEATSISGQVARQWKLRTLAQFKIANSNWHFPFGCADVKVGGSATCKKAAGGKCVLKCRGPAVKLGIDETGATAKVQGQTFNVARYCVCKRADPIDAGDAERNPSSGSNGRARVCGGILCRGFERKAAGRFLRRALRAPRAASVRARLRPPRLCPVGPPSLLAGAASAAGLRF